MKRTLSVLALLGIVSFAANQSAEAAFSWNPLNWFGHGCNKCEKPKKECCPKVEKECPCTTGAAAPCNPNGNPCMQQKPCDPCDRLQQSQMGR